MKRISLNSTGIINACCNVLIKGKVIVYPTDTLYGFGVNANNREAIKKINRIKRRTMPLSGLAPDKRTALSWMRLSKNEKILVSKILGGNTTVIVPILKDIVDSLITGNDNTLGIRIPDHPFCNKLSKKFGGPITTTSVNRTGNPPMVNPDEIYEEFKNELDLLIEDGTIAGRGSSIYIYENGVLKKIR